MIKQLFSITIDHNRRITLAEPVTMPAYVDESLPFYGNGMATLVGQPARWLFAAVSGHWPDQPPGDAQTHTACSARQLIRLRQGEAWLLAGEIVDRWGWHIWPGLDKDGPMYHLDGVGDLFYDVEYVYATKRWIDRNVPPVAGVE